MSRMHDVMPPKPKAKKPEAFNVPENRIPVLDHKHRMRATVGKLATDATVSRFIGRRGSMLKKVQGRQCWVGLTLATVSAEGTNPNIPKPKIGGAP